MFVSLLLLFLLYLVGEEWEKYAEIVAEIIVSFLTMSEVVVQNQIKLNVSHIDFTHFQIITHKRAKEIRFSIFHLIYLMDSFSSPRNLLEIILVM